MLITRKKQKTKTQETTPPPKPKNQNKKQKRKEISRNFEPVLGWHCKALGWLIVLSVIGTLEGNSQRRPAVQTVSYCGFGTVINTINLNGDDHAFSSSVKTVAMRQKLPFPNDTLIEIVSHLCPSLFLQ